MDNFETYNNSTFRSALTDCCDPELFDVILSDEEIDEIWDEFVRRTKKSGIPETYLDWRATVYDAMVELGYELQPEN